MIKIGMSFATIPRKEDTMFTRIFGVTRLFRKTLGILSFMPFLLLAQEVEVFLAKAAPVKDPKSPLWNQAKEVKLPLLPQNFVVPGITQVTVPYIRVRSLADGNYLALLLTWDDSTRNVEVDVDRFCDQVAVMFPLDPSHPPSFMMGNKKGRVHIIHWKARWQEDLDRGYQDVQTLYPNYWVDLYFFHDRVLYAEGEIQEPGVGEFKTPEALNYMPGIYARNPVSQLQRKEPVEELTADGYGTLTTQYKQNGKGRGIWEEGVWKVVLARPLFSDDPLDAPLPEKTFLAVAVWEGNSGNVGARKNVTSWVPLIFLKK